MKRLLALVLSIPALGAAAWAQAPTVLLSDDQPGFYMNFDNETSDFNGYGYKEWWTDGLWDYTGGAMTSTAEGGSWGRLKTSRKDDHETPAALSADQDWVFSMIWTNNVGTGTTVFEAMAGGSGGDIAKFTGDGGGLVEGNTRFRLLANASYGTVVSLTIPLGETHKLTLAYEAADGRLDFYLDETLVRENFEARIGRYNFGRFQVLGGAHSKPGDVFDEIIAGPAGPPVLGECDPGDADADGDVDDDDLSLLLANWGSETATCRQGEFSGSAPVNDDDLSLLLANWTGSPPGAVPGPTTMAILAACALILPRWRK